MNEGYKNSKLGLIPESWDAIPIYELRDKTDRYSFTGGPFGSDLKSEHYTEFGVQVIQLQNIGEGEFINKSQIYTSEKKADELHSCNIYPDDIIMAKMAPVARSCKIPSFSSRFVMGSDGIRLAVDRSKYYNEYIFQALNTNYFRKEAESKSTGSTRARIGLNELKLIPIAIPRSISEQQKIAEILSTVDAKIEVIDQQITETQELKKGLMQRLLTKGIGHTEFKDSPLGKIPKSWEVVDFDKVCKNKPTKYNKPNGRCIELEHIEQQTSRLLGYANIEDKSSVKNAFNIGDVLFCKLRPYLRKFWKCEFEGGCTSELMVLSPKGNLTTDYLFYTIQQDSFIENSVSKSYGTKMPRTSWKILSEFKMGLPSIEEQNKIGLIFNTITDKLDMLSKKKTHYQELKQGLMQQLLTGKVRVKLNAEA